MKTRARKNKAETQGTLFDKKFPSPDFDSLLRHPLIKEPLPSNFNLSEESSHLRDLWNSVKSLSNYSYEEFVHAGGSGIVFKVCDDKGVAWAMKIVRKKVYDLENKSGEVATTLSPVSEEELSALQKLSHPNVVRLREAIANARGVIAICTTYVERPKSLDDYLATTLQKDPDPKRKRGVRPFSPRRLDDACAFLAQKCTEIASAIAHMHALHIYHFDVKPANILVSEKSQGVMLTDMGSCIHADVIKQDKLRVHFTWTYAHPLLTTIVSHPQSISGGGLKASGEIVVKDHLARFDLFAFGKTIQEALAIIENEFGERCHASYGFRFLHIIACLLLDGFNSPAKAESRRSQIVKKDGRSFVKDVALDYPPEIFEQNKITSALELTERLARFGRDYSWNAHTPELDRWQPETINAQLGPAPFTERVSQLFNHRCLRRLKRTYHLGWMKEIFPGATHDRWTHSLGVFSSVVSYYNSLLADPAVPTFRILADGIDFEHAFTAAILHDLGQSTFGHDLEEACPQLFSHEDFLFRLLDEPFFGDLSLAAVLQRYWPRVSLSRLKSILQRRHRKTSSDHADTSTIFRMVDGVAADAIDGPIDADKFDYLLRDSTGCGVPYGHGMDRPRFLQALTVGTAKIAQDRFRLTLAYKAKGRPAIESLLLARYQMYGAIYWHHTYRCIQSMFVHAAASTFSESSSKSAKRLDTNGLQADTIHEVLYHRVICGKTWTETQEALNPHQAAQLTKFLVTAPSLVAEEPVLDFVWQFASPGIRDLIERLGARKLYKRIFEITVAELGSSTNYSELKSELSPAQRLKKAEKIQKRLLDEALNSMRKRGATETASETAAKERHKQLLASNVPLVTLDFPTRGIGKEKNLPSEIGDPARKYSTLAKQSNMPDNNVFQIVRELHERIATIRVFAAPECHELLIRYLTPDQIRQCVASVIDQIPES